MKRKAGYYSTFGRPVQTGCGHETDTLYFGSALSQDGDTFTITGDVREIYTQEEYNSLCVEFENSGKDLYFLANMQQSINMLEYDWPIYIPFVWYHLHVWWKINSSLLTYPFPENVGGDNYVRSDGGNLYFIVNQSANGHGDTGIATYFDYYDESYDTLVDTIEDTSFTYYDGYTDGDYRYKEV